jgi:hypothetical protein
MKSDFVMNLLPLLHKLTKQDRDNIWFAVWQLRPDKRSMLANYGKIPGIGPLNLDEVIIVLREAESQLPGGAADTTIRNLQILRDLVEEQTAKSG